jgi:hypothetical protein
MSIIKIAGEPEKFPVSPTEKSPALAEWWLTVPATGFTMTRSGEAEASSGGDQLAEE